MKETRVQTIYRLKRVGHTNKEIAEHLETSVESLNGTISSEKYRNYREEMDQYWESLRNRSPQERTRELVNKMLESAEELVASAGSARERLKHVDTIQSLVRTIGISADETGKMNVALISEFGEEKFDELASNSSKDTERVDLRTDPDDDWKERDVFSSQPLEPAGRLPVGDDGGDSKVCTGASAVKGSKGQSPLWSPETGQGYETPALTRMSESEKSIWDDLEEIESL